MLPVVLSAFLGEAQRFGFSVVLGMFDLVKWLWVESRCGEGLEGGWG